MNLKFLDKLSVFSLFKANGTNPANLTNPISSQLVLQQPNSTSTPSSFTSTNLNQSSTITLVSNGVYKKSSDGKRSQATVVHSMSSLPLVSSSGSATTSTTTQQPTKEKSSFFGGGHKRVPSYNEIHTQSKSFIDKIFQTSSHSNHQNTNTNNNNNSGAIIKDDFNLSNGGNCSIHSAHISIEIAEVSCVKCS